MKFGLVESFGVDNGELPKVKISAGRKLSVEWEMFRQKLSKNQPFKDLCNAANTSRLVVLAERQGRFVETYPEHDGWTEIVVGDFK